jgi:hypothetical protein
MTMYYAIHISILLNQKDAQKVTLMGYIYNQLNLKTAMFKGLKGKGETEKRNVQRKKSSNSAT